MRELRYLRIAEIQRIRLYKSEGQAQRAGRVGVKSEELRNFTLVFKVGLRWLYPACQERVIEIADELVCWPCQWWAYLLGPYLQTRKTITLDRDDVVCVKVIGLVVNGENW